MDLSIVSPVFKGEKIVSHLVAGIVDALDSLPITYEILLVDDGSLDLSWQAIEKASRLNSHVIGIKLSRNFGQHTAITAGLHHSTGTFVVVMDCDLQDNPMEIPRLLSEIQKGSDYVLAQRIEKKHTLCQRISSRLFYGIFTQ